MAEKKANILTIYNICRDLVTQAEASAIINEGEVDKNILPPLQEAFEQVIEFEKIHLIMAYDVFYGAVLTSVTTKIKFNLRGPMDLDVSKEPIELLFNPMFLAKYSYSEFTALVVSEIFRLVYEHPATFGDLNAEMDKENHMNLEKGSSASIASMVQHDVRLDKDNASARLRLPRGTYTTAKINEETHRTPKDDSSMDYYYRFLKQFGPPLPPPEEGEGQGEGQGMGMTAPGQGEDGDGDSPATENNNNGQQPHQWEQVDSEDAKDRIKGLIGDVYSKLDDRARGLMPAGLQEQIKFLLRKPEISWKQILKKYLGTVPVPYRRTKTRLNRRQPYRPDLSGKLPKRHIEIVLAIDTSGSMSAEDLEYVTNEIFSIVKDYDTKVTIIECDSAIGAIYTAKNPSDIHTKFTGRGGTSFIPVIEHINESNQYRNALMVYFTDGYGDSEIPKPRTLRNLWIVIDSEENLSLAEPFGEVKALKKDADWVKMNKKKGY